MTSATRSTVGTTAHLGQALALRCRIVLACAEGATNSEVAARLGVSRSTVAKWRSRFVERRLDGLHDEPRPGGPRKIIDADVERVIVKTLEETPRDATHWSTRSMAAATGMSQSAVSRTRRASNLGERRLGPPGWRRLLLGRRRLVW
jgi:transposase